MSIEARRFHDAQVGAARGHDIVDLVGTGDVAAGKRRDLRLVANLIAERSEEVRTVEGLRFERGFSLIRNSR